MKKSIYFKNFKEIPTMFLTKKLIARKKCIPILPRHLDLAAKRQNKYKERQSTDVSFIINMLIGLEGVHLVQVQMGVCTYLFWKLK